MKREKSKFRYWDSFNEEMTYCSEEYSDYLSKFFIEYDYAVMGGNNPVLMEFTGLKDKNGKEIYEGDIVKFGTDKRVVMLEENRQVSYGHGDCGETLMIGFLIGSSYGKHNVIEVIGNIHENPELVGI